MFKNYLITIIASVFILTIALIPSQLSDAQTSKSSAPKLTIGATSPATTNIGTDPMKITVTWSDFSGTKWEVRKDGVLAQTVTSRTATFNSLEKNVSHCFTVKRILPSPGLLESDKKCSAVQSAISSLTQTGLTQVKIAWTQTAATDPSQSLTSKSNFKVERVLSPGQTKQVCSTGNPNCSSTFIQITPTGTGLSHTDNTVVAGSEYCYELQATWPSPRSHTMDSDRICIKIDNTPPVISYTVNPSDPTGNNGWYTDSPTVTWTVTENESPTTVIKTGCVDTTFDYDTPTAGETLTCSATSAGGASATTSVTISRDATPPEITLDGDNPLALENNGEPYIDDGATASDGSGSGVSGSILVGGDTVDTGTVGSYDVTFDVSDNAGNPAVQVIRNVSIIDFEFTTPSYLIGETDSDRDYFSIIDTAPAAGPVIARIYASANDPLDDTNGFDVVLSDVGGSRYASPSILFTSGVTDADNNKLHVESGFRIFVNYRDVISDPPGVAAAELAAGGAGSPPSPTDTVQFDSDAFRFETSTNVKVIDSTRAGTGSVTVTIDNVNSAAAADTFSLTLNELPAPNQGTFVSTNQLLFSNALGSSSSATSPILHVNVNDVVSATYTPPDPDKVATATIIPAPAELTLNAAGQPVFGTKPDCVTFFGNSDTDADGWCNFMETGSGLQVRLTSTSSPVVYTYACSRLLDAPGATTNDAINPVVCPSPTVKDIYVEVDYMTNHRPDYNALLDVINYFRTLPTPIMLHIQVDEDIGFHTNVMPYQKVLAPGTPYSVQAQKEIHFGTVVDRSGSNSQDTPLLTGKRQAFHWALFTHQLTEFPQSSGYSEIWGNDFAVSLGAFNNRVGTQDQQAASFLHELGHNLNLKHDAGVTTNGAPNWISVMNYALQFPQESGGFIPKANWKLAYSSFRFNPLYETNLAETVAGGITGTNAPNLYTVVGPAGGAPFVTQTNTAVNWNGGSTGGTGINLSVHTFPSLGLTSTTPKTLTSQNDITSMSLNFKNSGNFATGLSTVPHSDIDAAVVNPNTIDIPADTSDPAVGAVASVGPFDEGVNTGDIGLGTIIDYDSTTLTIDVDWGDGSAPETTVISDLDPDEPDHIGVFSINGDHTYPDNGVYDITISVTNNREGLVPTPVVVSIPGVVVNNVAPTITAIIQDPTPVNAGSLATITVTATDPAGVNDPLQYEFDCTNNGTYEIMPQAGNSAQCFAPSNPSFTVGVRVTDGDGGEDTDTKVVSVNTLVPATVVLGQTGFGSGGSGNSANNLKNPDGSAFDGLGNLWVADQENNRVVMYPVGSLGTNGAAATVVLGQTGFGSGNTGSGNSAFKLKTPDGLAFDEAGNLWVTDQENNRVVMYPVANLVTNGQATVVLGQTGFGLGGSGTTANNNLKVPHRLAFDEAGNLWVTDSTNNRVVMYLKENLSTNGAPATVVLGQASFTTSVTGNSITNLKSPDGLAFDLAGNLWVVDELNHRVVKYLVNASPP